MWSCAAWPSCAGAINIEPGASDPPTGIRHPRPTAGSSLQARFERERALFRLKRRAYLPLLVAIVIVCMAVLFVGMLPVVGPAIAGTAAAIAGGAVFLFAMTRLPPDALAWARRAEGERRVAGWLAPLESRGYIILHGQRIPGRRGDIDHLVIGPTGVFVVEAKNWSNRAEVIADRLLVGDRDRTWSVDQLYRAAVAVQIALGDCLTRHHLTVYPALCALKGSRGRSQLGGVAIVGRWGLTRWILDRPHVLTQDAVLEVARIADERLPTVPPWDALHR